MKKVKVTNACKCHMKMVNSKPEETYVYEYDLPPEDETMLMNYGLSHIKEDKKELINYAVNKILDQYATLRWDSLSKTELAIAQKLCVKIAEEHDRNNLIHNLN